MTRPLMNAADVSELTRVPQPTIRTWARRNQIPHIKLGSLLRFDPAEIEDWINESRVPRSGDCVVSGKSRE